MADAFAGSAQSQPKPRHACRRLGFAVAGLVVATSVVLVLVTTSAARNVAAPKTVGAALLGPKNDGSYNQSVYTGLLRAKAKFGTKLTVVDNVSDKSKEIDVLRSLAQNNALVVAAS